MAIAHLSTRPTFLLSSLLLFFLSSSNKFNAYGGGGGGGGATETIHHYNHVVRISSLLPATVCSTSKGPNSRSSLNIVHRHGPCSQLDREKEKAPPISQILLQDQSRVDSLQSRLSNNSERVKVKDSDQAKLPAHSGRSLGSGNYIVNVGFGRPKRDLSVIFDTGSDLTWIQCEPCARHCYEQQDPIFDPSKSSSYSNITCNTPECSQLASATGNTLDCSSSSACIYGIQYGDQSYSVGFFAKDTLTLSPNDVFPNFQFGCGQNNRGLFGNVAGLIGLGRDKLSLVSQTVAEYGRVFSYCLPSTSSSTGYLTFGNDGVVSSAIKFTPLLINSQGPSFYFLDLIAMSVGGRKLPISASVFSKSGTIIDSGTVITRLPPSAYAALRSAFRLLMSNYPSAQSLSILDTCYDLSQNDTVTVPQISIYFGGGVKVDLDLSGILLVASVSQVCLAFAGNGDASDVAILGNKQQQTLEVIYDVAKGRLGFGSGGCS